MELLLEYWPVVIGLGTAFVTVLAWLMRLEARGLANEREIRRLWLQRKEDLEAARVAREETARMLSEIRADIKQLLARAR